MRGVRDVALSPTGAHHRRVMIRPLALLAVCCAIGVLVGCRGDVGHLCESDKDCRGELMCAYIRLGSDGPKRDAGGNRCTAPCERQEDCDSETEYCSAWGCVNSCESDDACPEPLACLEGRCVLTCLESEDCEIGTCPEPGGFCVTEP